MKQSHVWKRGPYICIQVLIAYYLLSFLLTTKSLLNTKLHTFSLQRQKLNCIFITPKVNGPLRLLSYVDNRLSCVAHVLDVILYQEVQGLSERMYILRLKVLKPNDLKTPPPETI